MQLRLPWREKSAESTPTVLIDGRPFAVLVARHRRARRYVLRMTKSGQLRLTVPRGASIRAGLVFAERQAEWIRREQLRQAAADRPWDHGTLVWWRGELVRLDVADGIVTCDEVRATVGSNGTVRKTLELEFRRHATIELPPRLRELATRHGASISRVSVRNQRSRWGACGPSGHITLNWRLLQMPRQVADYVMLHELTHLTHPHHRPSFWRKVGTVCPEWRDAERWIRKHGRELL
jgi:predicted metal-dependent hydrolase